MRRLFFDLETSPNLGLYWDSGFKKHILHQGIIKERAIICVAYKWEGNKKVTHYQWDRDQCDKKLLETFIPIMNEADEVIAHNGDEFDIKWLRTRCLKHDVDMFPKYTSVDTLKQAKKYFRFNSNTLDYITTFLGLKGKDKTEFDMWKRIMVKNCSRTMRAMVSYCKNDVVQLEEMFNRFKKYTDPVSNYATQINHCPECNSSNVYIRAYRISVQGYKKVQFQCQDCGKYQTVAASRFAKEAKL